jgi:acyl-CoA reductase-like NAD-dependent aldehyde dehydrogenase
MVYDIYQSGTFIKTDQVLDVYNPFDQSLVGKTYLADKKILEEAINDGIKCRSELKKLPSYKRYKILTDIAHLIEKDKERIAEVLSAEACKPIKYAKGEVERAIQTFIVAAEESKRLPKEYISLDWTESGFNKEGLIKYFPIGLIAGISPFNFPLNLAVHKIAPAIASSNPIILKPSRSTPLSVLELAKIIDQTDLPKGAISILPMDRETGNQLITDHRINKITFTGSPDIGWKMKSQAGKKKITLELGGNAGVIISETANIKKAIQRCVIGSFAYSGQVCIHLQRILVHKDIFETFVSEFTQQVKNLKFGHPGDPETDISSMIDMENAIRVESWVDEAVSHGAKILAGGERKGCYYKPTVLTNTDPKMKVCSNEVFGPVVSIEPFTDFQNAIKEINNSDFGLQAGVYTDSIHEMNYAFEEIEAGGVIINDIPTFRVDHMPYGGIKDSGMGREGIKYAIYEMMEPKLLVKNQIS